MSKISSRQQQKIKHGKIKGKQSRNHQIISTLREKIPKCENKQKQEKPQIPN